MTGSSWISDKAFSDQEHCYGAKLAEQAERFDDMKAFMNRFAQNVPKLQNDERNLLSVAYKNVIGSRRSAYRILAGTPKSDMPKEKLDIVNHYKSKIIAELKEISEEVLVGYHFRLYFQSLLDEKLIPSAETEESRAFYYKMQGDYHRYLAEVTEGDERKSAIEKSNTAYEKATEEANKLSKTHPIRLGLALNYSVFYYEILNETDKACQLAKDAFTDALKELDHLQEDSYKDSTLIMQLLRDNLTLWSSDKTEEGPEPVA